MRHAAHVLLAMIARLCRGLAEFLSRLAERPANGIPPPCDFAQGKPVEPPRPPESWLERAKPPPPAHWLARVRAATPERSAPPPAHWLQRVRAADAPTPRFSRVPVPDGPEPQVESSEPFDSPVSDGLAQGKPKLAPCRPTDLRFRPRPELRAVQFEERPGPNTPPSPRYTPETVSRTEGSVLEHPSDRRTVEVPVAYDRQGHPPRAAALTYPAVEETPPLPTAWPEPAEDRRVATSSFPSATAPSAGTELRFESPLESLPDRLPSFPTSSPTQAKAPTYPARRAHSLASETRKDESDPWPALPEFALGDEEDAWNERAREAARRRRLDREQRGAPWNE